MSASGWIGVDLDGTLAEYGNTKHDEPQYIAVATNTPIEREK